MSSNLTPSVPVTEPKVDLVHPSVPRLTSGHVGSAGQHLVCADLQLKGYAAYLAGDGLPYDVVVDHDHFLYRIQVKSTLSPRIRSNRQMYQFCVSRKVSGSHARGSKAYADHDCDYFAFVALDVKRVMYMPYYRLHNALDSIPRTLRVDIADFNNNNFP